MLRQHRYITQIYAHLSGTHAHTSALPDTLPVSECQSSFTSLPSTTSCIAVKSEKIASDQNGYHFYVTV